MIHVPVKFNPCSIPSSNTLMIQYETKQYTPRFFITRSPQHCINYIESGSTDNRESHIWYRRYGSLLKQCLKREQYHHKLPRLRVNMSKLVRWRIVYTARNHIHLRALSATCITPNAEHQPFIYWYSNLSLSSRFINTVLHCSSVNNLNHRWYELTHVVMLSIVPNVDTFRFWSVSSDMS